ncbi:MAG: hypothetical protein ACJ75H_03325 [Thermoanaerobaculia bacterium]
MLQKKSFVSAAVLSLTLAATAAWAEPGCKMVHSRVDLTANAPTCGSAIGLCASGVLKGGLQAHSEFIGTSAVPTVDTPATGVLVLTGDNTIHTDDGDLFTKDTIVLATTGAGEFGEIDTVVGGTGAWAGATGKLTGTGTFANGVGFGVLIGEVCTP